MPEIESPEMVRRRRVVHGWAFRRHTPEQQAAIRDYLETGLTTFEHFPDSYRILDKVVK